MRIFFSFVLAMFCCLPISYANMSIGDSGDEVVQVQKQLVARGYSLNSLDGSYGNETASAVKQFQEKFKLPVTGELDKVTYRYLMHVELPNRFSFEGSIGKIRQLISTAMSLRGVPYVFGGTSPSGFDCSGFVQYLFNGAGISLPRMADAQYYATNRVDVPRMGDLVFFETYTSGVSHVGMSIGGRDFIHASSSNGITVSSLDDSYWSPRYVGAGRVFPN